MIDDSKPKDVVDAVTGLVKAIPIYQDVAQPAAQELGRALHTVAKTVHIALAPVSALVWGYDKIKDFVSTKVADRLKHVPTENIISPKPNVAGPALEALRYTGHEDKLSNMYANLLASAMDSGTAEGAHPAFVEIIKQMTPDEAKLVSLFLIEIPFPLLDVRWEFKAPAEGMSGGKEVLVNYSHLGELAGCEFKHLVPVYIDNLCRLGLSDIPSMFMYTAPGVYDALEKSPAVEQLKKQIETNEKWNAVLQRKGLRITELGKQFARVCVARKE